MCSRVRAMAIEKDEQGRPKFQRPCADLKKKITKARRPGIINLPTDNPEWADSTAGLAAEMVDMLQELCVHYGILPSPNQYAFLAFHLAKDYVPNFDLLDSSKGRGAPKKHSVISDAHLVAEIDELNSKRKRGIADACCTLSMRNGKWKGKEPGTLQTLYYAAKKRGAAVSKATKNDE